MASALPLALDDHSYPKVEFRNISSDILGAHDVCLFYITLYGTHARTRMNLATIRVEGKRADLASLVGSLGLEVDREWRAGERSRAGRIRELNGASATILDAGSPMELENSLGVFSEQCAKSGVNFRTLGLSAIVSIGVTVGDSEQFIASVELPTELLAIFGDLGISIEFNAYPTSDEANAT